MRDERFRWDDRPKSIALAMGEAVEDEGPMDPRRDERVVQGWTNLDHPAWQES